MCMKIAIITQPDNLVIPKNVCLLAEADFVHLAAVLVLDVKGSLMNKRGVFFRGFGFIQMSKLAFTIVFDKVLKILQGRHESLRKIARFYNADFKTVKSLHEEPMLKYLAALNLDLIVSYSAPIVFKKELLSIPRHGCINLHCSRLPHFAGLLPSFWVLYFQENIVGATIHYMDDRIDNGGILAQVEIPLNGAESMYDVIRITKESGGKLMLEVLKAFKSGRIKVEENDPERGSYYTWPTVDEMRNFRKRGGRLI